MEFLNVLTTCNRIGHQNNPLILICLDERCYKERLICPLCFVEGHFHHKEKVNKLSEFCSKILEEPDEKKEMFILINLHKFMSF